LSSLVQKGGGVEVQDDQPPQGIPRDLLQFSEDEVLRLRMMIFNNRLYKVHFIIFSILGRMML
jgi:hypothetical protein